MSVVYAKRTLSGNKATSRRIGLALLGAGRMGTWHLRAGAKATGVSIDDVVEPRESARASLEGAGYRVHPSLDALLNGRRPAGVIVAAPSALHRQLVSTCLREGVPVLCEKPVGLNLSEAEEIRRIAMATTTPIRVGYWRRFVPRLRRLQMQIQSGAMGNIHLILASQWDHQPPSRDFRAQSGGIIVDMGVHEIDQIRWLSGQEVASLSAAAAKYRVDPSVTDDESAQLLLELTGGTTGIVSLGRYYPVGDMAGVEVFGELGHERLMFLPPSIRGETGFLSALRSQLEDFARLIRLESDSTISATIDDAVSAMQVAERATTDLLSGTANAPLESQSNER